MKEADVSTTFAHKMKLRAAQAIREKEKALHEKDLKEDAEYTEVIDKVIASMESRIEREAERGGHKLSVIRFECGSSFFGKPKPEGKRELRHLKGAERVKAAIEERGMTAIFDLNSVFDEPWAVIAKWSDPKDSK